MQFVTFNLDGEARVVNVDDIGEATFKDGHLELVIGDRAKHFTLVNLKGDEAAKAVAILCELPRFRSLSPE